MSKARAEFEQKVKEIEHFNENRMQKAVEHLTISKQTDLAEVEERKNKQLDDLVKAHDKAFLELKNYYNDITLNNLALISSLKVSMNIFFQLVFWK